MLSVSNSETGAGYGINVGNATTGSGYGIYSGLTGAANTGYAGYFTNTATTTNYGVYSTIASVTTGAAVVGSITGTANTGYGGYFANTSTGVANYGLYASTSTSSSSGYAGYFKGNAYVSGDINDANVTSCSTLGSRQQRQAHLRGGAAADLYLEADCKRFGEPAMDEHPDAATDTLFLNCSGLVASSTSTIVQLQVGEGATPTWETGAHYTITRDYVDADGLPRNRLPSDSWVMAPLLRPAIPMSLKAWHR